MDSPQGLRAEFFVASLVCGQKLAPVEIWPAVEYPPFRDFFGGVFFFSLGGAVWLALGAALLSLVGVIVTGLIVGKRAKLSPVGSLNTSFTLLARGEFSIIIANLAQAGGLAAILQPFAALYVLILASAALLLAKESERIYGLYSKLFGRRGKGEAAEGETEEARV
jgi:CPA2 family monovalent cation:H+ antiporter-2